jgi:hypothetical protein
VTDLGSEALVVGASVGKREDIERMYKEISEKWGRVDVLVNNAGVYIVRVCRVGVCWLGGLGGGWGGSCVYVCACVCVCVCVWAKVQVSGCDVWRIPICCVRVQEWPYCSLLDAYLQCCVGRLEGTSMQISGLFFLWIKHRASLG